MATQVKDKAAGKNDTFIEAQLARAQNRIRFLDLLTALLGFLAGTLGFAVLMILLDRRWELSAGVRQGALVVYLVGATLYLLYTVVRPLTWRVNPYFAARRLEETLPGSRNHVINWIDLHGVMVPSVLNGALGQRAAKDLAKTDVDGAISTKRAVSVGGAAGAFFVLFIGLFFLFGPRPFASLFGRLFAPFGSNGRIASRTEVDVVRPRSTTVTIGNAVTIVAVVGGRVPDARADDAPCLLYRHNESEPYRKRFLQADDSNQEWSTTISPIDVGDGFSYKVAAGDAETEVYHVGVRAAPLISDFKATYHYRPYTGKAAQTRTSRKLEDLRGTEVEINALTNRTIKDGRLEFDGDDGNGAEVRAEPVANDPQRLRFRMVLDRQGKYRIRFTSTENEAYIDSTSHEVVVFPDNPPQVRLIEPGKDVVLPANGQLELKGEASDDFGIGSLTLQLHIVGGGRLESKPYLPDKLGKPNYGTPRNVDYRELLVLNTLKTHDGKPAELAPGMEIEYWLEAADACDYHRPNVTSSQPHFKIKIAPADKDNAQRQKERDEAKARQKEHEKQESQRMKKEQEARDEQKRKDEAAEKEKSRAEEKHGKENKEGGKKEEGEKKPGEKSESKEGGNAGDKKKDQETQSKADELKNRLDQKEQKGNNKSEQEKRGEARGSGEDKKPGQGKDQGEKKPGQSEGKDNKPGESRDNGGQGQKNPAGEKKEGGKPGEQGTARGENRPDPAGQKGEAKKPGEKGTEGKAQPGQSKETPRPKSNPGEAKDQGKGDPTKTAGQRKPEDKSKPGEPKQQGEAKDKGTPGKPSDTKPGERKEGAKPPPPDGPKGECKECNGNGGNGKSGAGAKGSKEAGKGKPSGLNGDGSSNKAGEKKEDGRSEGKQQGEKKTNDTPAGQDKPAGEGNVKKGEKKEGPGKDGQGEGKGSEQKEQAEKGNSKGAPREGEAPGKGKDRGKGETPGPGMKGEREPGNGKGGGEDPKAQPEKPEAHRASTLQLEEFRKKVDRDILKDMKMSKEDFDKFLKDYADLVKRQAQKADTDAPEAIAPPKAGGTLPTIASGPRKTTGSGKMDDLKNDGRAQPPPGYRDKYEDFVRRLNTPKK